MHWLDLDALIVATVCLSSIALLALLVLGFILGCFFYKQGRLQTDTSSTKGLLATDTPNFIKSEKSVNRDSVSIAVEEQALNDEEEGLPNFITEALRPPQTVTVGVGSLRQVSLSILHDLLLSLTNVRLKTDPKVTTSETNVITTLKRSVAIADTSAFFNPKPPTSNSRYLHNTYRESSTIQAAILEDFLRQDVKADNVTGSSLQNPKISDIRRRSVISQGGDCEMTVLMSEEEMTDALRDNVTKQLDYIFADDVRRHETFRSILEAIVCAPTAQLLIDTIYRMFRVNHAVMQQWKVEEGSLVGVDPTDAQGDAILKVDFSSNNATILLDGPFYGSDILHSVSRICQNIREEGRQPTYSEYVAIHLAHYKLSRGCSLSHLPFKTLGSPGFSSPTQTHVSLTDPGKGHVVGTTRFKQLMERTVLNVERLETDSMLSADMIDLRVPPLLNLAQVRLHVGESAPTTYFIGKAMKEESDEHFERDVHMAACSAITAFRYGAAECKLCVCELTSTQALRYMRTLRARVSRQPGQYLCAAWNLNRSITDDYQRPEPREITTRKDIALAAVEITSMAGFDSVALCGATTTCSCRDTVSQIGFEQALVFNHEAHIRGLITSFSSGLKTNEIENAVLTGADIVVLGGARVLRYMDKESEVEENISMILQNRDDAAGSVRGKGAHLLVRLDTMFFEGSINEEQNNIRLKLFDALIGKCESDIKGLMKVLTEVDSLPVNSGLPPAGTARRLLAAKDPLLRDVFDSGFEWEQFAKCLEHALTSNDYNSLLEEYQSEPWRVYRQRYRDGMGIRTYRD